ncbi:ATP-binding protein [Tenacibaculum sp. TC6]|uniref:ATP-binding protein n=1 Tax=Tenacibaculum sp. TC6 TaxID=3423223 RepID=UPI003D35C0F2
MVINNEMIKRFFLLFTSLFLLLSCSLPKDENHLYEKISVISSDTSLTIKEAIEKFNSSSVPKKKLNHIYKKLGDKQWWFHIPVEASDDEQLFTLSFPYLAYGKVYIHSAGTIQPLHQTSYYKDFPFTFLFYRHPTWEIPADLFNNREVYLEIKNGGSRTRLEFHLETKNQFLKRIQLEYIQYGLFLAFLCSLIIILLYFALLKKEYSVIFYAVYIFCMVIEFLAGKGLGIQFLWSDYPFIIQNIRSFIQTVAVFAVGHFYMSFYSFSSKEIVSKNLFKWGTYLTLPIMLLYLYKYIYGGLSSLYLYVWIVLKIIILVWFINHLYLARKKRIPGYLVLAFALPILSIIISQSINPNNSDSYLWKYGTANIFYIALLIEILLFTRYIFSSVILSQKKYVELKKISDELRYNFQNKTLEIQQDERNKLLSNVHDSFGGYLEALKLRLLATSSDSSEKIQEILDSFYKEYRYLLNTLYSPKINSENLTDNLINYCEKINQITESTISYHIALGNSLVYPAKCMHLYRILSELITNAIKHAKATEISIHILEEDKEYIIVKVIDNGIGFSTSTISLNSYGLKNVKERVAEINGEFTIESKKNSGTSVIIKFPKDV